jgi:Protein of unknown function (DUF2855)
MTTRTELHVDRHSIGATRLVETEVQDLAEGQVRLDVEYYALTANNITYAQFGDMLAYWDFYPVGNEWGNVPAMGYAVVTDSRVPGIEPRHRFYGWYPMASSIDVTATPTRNGFRDDGPHRAPHAAVYREFVRTDSDPLATTAEDEPRQPLLRGLFMTGFLADAFYAADAYRGAAQSVVLSASSKTAIGYAWSAKRTGSTRVVGVTSGSNAEFVRALGCYDEVVTYTALDQIAAVPSVVVDMAGNAAAVAEIHRRLGDLVVHSMVVGKSHHDATPTAIEHGPTPEMFFAPGAVASRLEEWGHEGYQQRVSGALAEFLTWSHEWLTIDHRHGPAAAQETWAELFAGKVAPSVGLLVSFE